MSHKLKAADELANQAANVIRKLSAYQLETRDLGELVIARDAYTAERAKSEVKRPEAKTSAGGRDLIQEIWDQEKRAEKAEQALIFFVADHDEQLKQAREGRAVAQELAETLTQQNKALRDALEGARASIKILGSQLHLVSELALEHFEESNQERESEWFGAIANTANFARTLYEDPALAAITAALSAQASSATARTEVSARELIDYMIKRHIQIFGDSPNAQSKIKDAAYQASDLLSVMQAERAPTEPVLPEPLCQKCGIGFILPSGACDHCDQKR